MFGFVIRMFEFVIIMFGFGLFRMVSFNFVVGISFNFVYLEWFRLILLFGLWLVWFWYGSCLDCGWNGLETADSAAIFLKMHPAKPTEWYQNRPFFTILMPENRPHSTITDRAHYIKPRKPTVFIRSRSVMRRSVM